MFFLRLALVLELLERYNLLCAWFVYTFFRRDVLIGRSSLLDVDSSELDLDDALKEVSSLRTLLPSEPSKASEPPSSSKLGGS